MMTAVLVKFWSSSGSDEWYQKFQNLKFIYAQIQWESDLSHNHNGMSSVDLEVTKDKKNGKETWLQMPIPALGLQKKAYGSALVENGACAELPPPYTAIASPDASGVPVINCRVCQSLINLDGKLHQHVVKCTVCNEATWMELRFNTLAKCPHCKKISSVGSALPRRRCCAYITIGMICIFIGVGLTVGTQDFARRFHATYVSWAVAYLLGLICLIRACYWGAIKVISKKCVQINLVNIGNKHDYGLEIADPDDEVVCHCNDLVK
ncbi:hypothetical protein BTVI_75374 [Pitangus sulphuratus]|nr:hypothetical protein BTVI_75374 [Pitangus sulphuratus]